MPINVLHMAHLTIRYGAEKQLLDYLTHTKENPNEIRHHVCALRVNNLIYEELKKLEIPLIVTRLWPWNITEFSKFLKTQNIHILHVHNQLRFPLRSRILPKFAGVPLILEHEHGMVWNTFSSRLIKWTNRLVNANICNSNAAKIMLKQKCDIEAKVIYNGIPIPLDQDEDKSQLKEELRLPEDTKFIGFVGRLNNPKGAEAFIRMIPVVSQVVPHAKFVIVGDGPMRNELENGAKSLGVEGKVYFLGYRKNAYHLMKQMDVVVVPSFREAFGNVVIEAALAKKPVVASNVDGLAETVINGETGFLIECTEPIPIRSAGASRIPKVVVDGRTRELRPPKLPNIEMLAEKVIKCLQDPEMASSLGNKAYLRAINTFSLERYCDDLNNVYRELISNYHVKIYTDYPVSSAQATAEE